jgi:hypothetical protein
MIRRFQIFFFGIILVACADDDTPTNKSPSDFEVRVIEIKKTSVYLHWSRANDPEGDSITYDIFLNNELVETGFRGFYYELTDLTPDSSYTGEIVAWDPHERSAHASFSFTTDSTKTIFEGDVMLVTQKQLNEFSSEGYRVIKGYLTIGGYCGGRPEYTCHKSDIIDLTPLSGLTKITSGLTVRLSKLTTLNGLNNVTDVGSLIIENNHELMDFEGLNGLQRVSGDIWIYQQHRVSELNAFANLSEVKGGLHIGPTGLISLAGIENIQNITGNLRIESNRHLKDYCSLTAILSENKVQGIISITGNSYFNPTVADIVSGNCSK